MDNQYLCLSLSKSSNDFFVKCQMTVIKYVLSFQIHANCRIRRVYFSDRLYSEDELPAEFKLYLPVQQNKTKVKQIHFVFNTGNTCIKTFWT